MNQIRQFIQETRRWGLKISLANALVAFTKWAIGAKSIQVTYWRNK